MRLPLTTAALLAALPLLATAQDPVEVDPAHYKVVLENAAVRVLKIDVPAGATSPMHSHADALLVPLAGGKARFTFPDGKTQDADLVADVPQYTPASTHAPSNVGTTAVQALLVEFKAKAAGKAALPASRPGIQTSSAAEGPYAVAFKATAGPDFQEPAGSSHDYDQVVVALATAEMTLAVEGKPPVTKWQRGDVQFIGRGVKHQSKNAGGKPIDFVIVAIR
jgi:quercetin dioxygenase-like cupin family protein